ncbi:MAG: alpha/beta hydrolase-fold protein, partial [Vicinamibacteria bacterium]
VGGVSVGLLLLGFQTGKGVPAPALRFEISFPGSLRSEPVDGRALLMLSTNDDAEPRFQIGTHLGTQQIFGTDADSLAPGESAVIDASSLGYPREALADIPAGEYYVQALINVYETFHRADGHVVKLPMDDGEGQLWESSPGNLYSEPMKLFIDPSRNETVHIPLSRIVPPIDPPEDTRFIKHVRLQSKLLSEFWGRPMYLGAIVLLPDEFESHPETRYPVLYWQDHFESSFGGGSGGFRETQPGPELTGRERLNAEYAHRFYLDWTSGKLPRMLIVSIQHANPYYDDSYGVNSANIGPYGDAIVQELIPYVEKEFRAIGEPWARALYGGSTGGWIALAQQIFYPDFFNGSWCFCPDPVDFRAYQQIDIYEDRNAYWSEGEWKRVPRIDRRDTNGDITATMEDANRFEEVIGTRGRSGGQWDAWQAVYSPVGPDGYPEPIYDKRTGVIDREVAEYWKEHYDLRHILERDWKKLGPKLSGKIHITIGDMDNYYLERAVRLLESFLESMHDPYYAGTIEYGDGRGHCYSGDPSIPQEVSGRTINQRYMPVIAEHMLKTAPPGADVKTWRY